MHRPLVTIAVLLALAGCSSAPAPVVTVTAPPATAAPTADPAADGWEHARAFTEAVFKSDYQAARPHVAPKGPAERYLTHQVARSEAMSAAGQDLGLDDPELTFDEAARSVTANYDGEEVVWKAFTYDSAGLVMGWETGAGIPVADRLWTKPAKASTRYAGVSLVSAYTNDAGLFVVLDVAAKGRALAPDCSALLDDTKKRQREASNCYAPETIAKGNSAYVVLEFSKASFGGTLRYRVQSSNYDELGTVKLPIR